VFARLEAVTEQLQVLYGRGLLRLNIPPFFASEMLLPRLPMLLEAQPDIDIHINTILAPLQTHPADADISIVVDAAPADGLASRKPFSQANRLTHSGSCAQHLPLTFGRGMNAAPGMGSSSRLTIFPAPAAALRARAS
jgi:DNA-binding transcriptional LysR family regulator